MKKGYGKLVFAGGVMAASLLGITGCTNDQAAEGIQEEGTPSVLDELYAGTMVEGNTNQDEVNGQQTGVEDAVGDDEQQMIVSTNRRAWADQLATVTSIQELYALATDEVLYDGERGEIRSDLIPEYRDSYRLYREKSGCGYHAYIVYLGQSIDIEGNEDGYVHCFGLTVDKNGERVEEGMLLDIEGEKVLVDYPYENTYIEYPEIAYVDMENDGDREVVISQWEFTGSPFRSKRLLVCDQKPFWRVYCYHAPDCIEDAEALVTTIYQEETDCLTFATTDGDVLYELELPDLGEEYPYSGDVRWQQGILNFDAHTFSMDVTPGNIMKDSPTYMPVTIRFHVGYENGAFYLMAPELHGPFDTKEEAYQAAVTSYVRYNIYPNAPLGYLKTQHPSDKNQYAICDVTGDGEPELLLRANDTSMANRSIYIYSCDLSGGNAEYPFQGGVYNAEPVFYDNGVITSYISHGAHKWGEDFWGIYVYEYDSETDLWNYHYWTDAWDLAYGEEYYDQTFPHEADIDGNGMVYWIAENLGDEWEDSDAMDDAEYEAWIYEKFGYANEIPVEWKYAIKDEK